MMKKVKLAIDVDEILRAKWLAFDRFFVEEFGAANVVEPFNTYEVRNHYKFEDKLERVNYLKDEFLQNEQFETLTPLEYEVDPETGVAPVDAVAFRTESKMLTADEVYDQFLYVDFCLQIFAAAPKIYGNADVDLAHFMRTYKDKFEFTIYCKEKKDVVISPTLFFLSKMKLIAKNIIFVSSNEELWSKTDWVLTTDPSVIADKPEGKIVIKMDRPYNMETEPDFAAYHILDLCRPDDSEEPNEFEEFVNHNIK